MTDKQDMPINPWKDDWNSPEAAVWERMFSSMVVAFRHAKELSSPAERELMLGSIASYGWVYGNMPGNVTDHIEEIA